MAKQVELGEVGQAITDIVQKNMSKYYPNSRQMRTALTRIGVLLDSLTKQNITQQQIVDTGRLLNSIMYEINMSQRNKSVLRFGSKGVPYAAIHEFGGNFTDQMRRAMFANLRAQGKLGRNPVKKNVIQGRKFMARPYLRPAVERATPEIRRILKSVMSM